MEYHFDGFILDLVKGELRGPDGPVPLRRQTFLLLEVLLRHAPALLGRDQLLDEVWGRSALSRNVLPQAISELRQALGDDPAAPRLIETRYRRGYRFIAELECRKQPQPSLEIAPEASASPGSTRRPWGSRSGARSFRPGWLLGAGFLLLFAASAWMILDRSTPSPEPSLAETEARLMDAASMALATGQPDRAIGALAALLELNPTDSSLRMALAEAELAALRGDAARATLAALDPALDSSRALRLRARIALLDGRIDPAQELAAAAVEQAYGEASPEALLMALREQIGIVRGAGRLTEAEAILLAALQQPDSGFDPGGRIELELERLALLRERGALDEARQRAEELAEAELTPALALRRAIEMALIDSEAGDQSAAWARLQSVNGLERLKPALALALANASGIVLVRSGELDAARQQFEAAFARARRSGAAVELAALQVNAGLLFARQRRMEEAEALWQEALANFDALGDRRGQAIVLGNLAAAASARGQQARSEELNGRALGVFRELKLDGPRARTAYNLGLARARAGALSEAADLYAEAAAAYAATGQSDLLLHVQASWAELLLEIRDPAAVSAMLGAVDDSGGVSDEALARLLVARARLAQRQGELERSRDLHERARMLRQRAGLEQWVAQSELDLLRLDFLQGRSPVEVRVSAETLGARFARWNEARALARSHQLVAEALLAQGRVNEARSALEQARVAADRFPDVVLDFELAWVEAWAAHADEFRPRLRALADRARALGLLGRLELSEWLLNWTESGRPGAAGQAMPTAEPLPPYMLAVLF